jgi:hypothetical protein
MTFFPGFSIPCSLPRLVSVRCKVRGSLTWTPPPKRVISRREVSD